MAVTPSCKKVSCSGIAVKSGFRFVPIIMLISSIDVMWTCCRKQPFNSIARASGIFSAIMYCKAIYNDQAQAAALMHLLFASGILLQNPMSLINVKLFKLNMTKLAAPLICSSNESRCLLEPLVETQLVVVGSCSRQHLNNAAALYSFPLPLSLCWRTDD